MKYISDRFFEPRSRFIVQEEERIIQDIMNSYDEDELHFAVELLFVAQDDDGNTGLLLEIEILESLSEEEQAKAKAGVSGKGVFEYVPEGTDDIFDGRAALRAFFKKEDCNGVDIEKTAKAFFAVVDT